MKRLCWLLSEEYNTYLIIGFIIDPIDPNFLHNTARHIYFEITVTSKQIIIYNTYYSPKKVIMDCELPELSYVPNKLLYL